MIATTPMSPGDDDMDLECGTRLLTTIVSVISAPNVRLIVQSA